MFEYIIGFTLLVSVIYWWLTKDQNYWKKRNVPFVPPKIIFGNMKDMVLMKKSFGQVFTDIYNDYKSHPFVGMFNMTKPVILINDLDIVRNVLVKEFNKFHDNTLEVQEDVDPILSKNPFFLKGDRWKLVRGQLTPLLTAAKIKSMSPLVQEVCKNMVKYLEHESIANEKDGIEVKELALKFTTDNVASCAFGLEGHSFDNPKAEFRKMVEEFLKPGIWESIKFIIIMLIPTLQKLLKIRFGQKDATDKFRRIIKETVKYRKDNNVTRNDFLDSIIELKSKPMPFEYTDDYMVAHALTFFFDGSETSSIVFSFALYELATNSDIQNKFLNEIKRILGKHDGSISFEAIQDMTYLDAIFQESLRKYPPLLVMSRECTEKSKFTTNSGEDLKVEKGTHVFIPVFALHRDSQYYPDADRFDPERFTDNAKHPLPKNCSFGFGDGPRICLGQKFANMQVKAGLIAVVSNFEVRVNKKTKIPFEMDTQAFLLNVKGGVWLNFYKRNN